MGFPADRGREKNENLVGSRIRLINHAATCEEMKMGMEPSSCREEVLFSNRDCTIWQCRCGIYHIRIHAATLHLTTAQFERVARVFKLMMGRAAGIGSPSPMTHAGLKRREGN